MEKVTLAVIAAGLRRRFAKMGPSERSKVREEIILKGDTLLKNKLELWGKMSEEDQILYGPHISSLAKVVHDLEHATEHSSMLIFEMAKAKIVMMEIHCLKNKEETVVE